jgi:hypothetical protein
MKKQVYSSFYLLGIIFLISSCNQEKQESVVPSNAEKAPSTAIEAMERESGVKFYKRDLVLKDAANLNLVVLRVASLDEYSLNQYLEGFELTINPVFEIQSKETELEGNSAQGNSVTKNALAIITEALSVKLQDGAIGYELTVRMKKQVFEQATRNGRIASYSATSEHISDEWPEQGVLTVESNATGGGYREVELTPQYRNHWYNTWQTVGTYTYGSYTNSSRTYIFSIDGPWKWKYIVKYNPMYACGACSNLVPGYSVQFLQI